MTNEPTPYVNLSVVTAQKNARHRVQRLRDLPENLRSGVVIDHDPHAADAAQSARDELEIKPGVEVVCAWLTKLNFGVANSLDVDLLNGKLGFYCAVIRSSFPAFCLTDDTLVEMARKTKFFPSVAEVSDFFEAMVTDHNAMIAMLDRCAAAPVERCGAVPSTKYIEDIIANAKPRPEEPEARHFDPRTAPTEPVQPIRSVEEQLRELGYTLDPDGKLRKI